MKEGVEWRRAASAAVASAPEQRHAPDRGKLAFHPLDSDAGLVVARPGDAGR